MSNGFTMVHKPFNGGAGGARTHDPRISFVGADTFHRRRNFLVFEGDFWKIVVK